ncbi:hypothetical protein [Tepidibacter hydrothermalis]|uniref:DUF3021 domain-containing protein n=1 Tax=Tepidibacter hydrothermalis TaxID=3036126 RepID=A0ABY8ECW8_9FIRM|nr:hypothetical protein [Tepidibacter hydrothermalis]WFD10757.1 hypothetical protein P4S50_01390 [Tepidibacter hydrothermalis]
MQFFGSLFMLFSGIIFKFFFLLSIIISIIAIFSSNYLLKNISMNKNIILEYMIVNIFLSMIGYSTLFFNINICFRYIIAITVWGIIILDCIYLIKTYVFNAKSRALKYR